MVEEICLITAASMVKKALVLLKEPGNEHLAEAQRELKSSISQICSMQLSEDWTCRSKDHNDQVEGLIRIIMSGLESPSEIELWFRGSSTDNTLKMYQECILMLINGLEMLVRLADMDTIVGYSPVERSEDHSFGFLIEDVSATKENLVPRLLLLCGLYSSSIDGLYADPWSSPSLATATKDLMETVSNRLPKTIGACSSTSMLETLVVNYVDHILELLRPIILRKRPKTDAPMSLTDPLDNTRRIQASKEFLWCLSSFESAFHTQEMFNRILPFAFSVIDDSNPRVRIIGLSALDHVNNHACRAWFLPWRDVVLNMIINAIEVSHSGLDANIWHRLFPLAVRVVIKVEGSNCRKSGYSALLMSILGGVSMGVLEQNKKLIVLDALDSLLPVMGLFTVRYFAVLMPVLCNYILSNDPDTVVSGLKTLLIVARYTWPRLNRHVHTIMRVLLEVHKSTLNSQDAWALTAQQTIKEVCTLLSACDTQQLLPVEFGPKTEDNDIYELLLLFELR